MGTVTSHLQFTGTVGNITFYRRKDSDKIYVRSKGGISRKDFYKKPSLARSRENAAEFGRCATAAGGLRKSLLSLQHLADYNFTPVLSGLCSKIQKLDTLNKRGERSVLLSQHPYFFNGFQLNRRNSFDSMLRCTINHRIDRDNSSAVVDIPALLPGVNLVLPWPVPQYRFIISLGLAPDQHYDARGIKAMTDTPNVEISSEWLAANQPFTGRSFPLQLKPTLLKEYILLLAIGIEMEIPQLKGWGGVQKIGAAKILGNV